MTMVGEGLFMFCLLLVIIYFITLSRWLIGWVLYPKPAETEVRNTGLKISVLVAVRNEEKEILNCLNALNNQYYTNFEVIISDDFSEDNTAGIVEAFIRENDATRKKWRLIRAVEGNSTGKKAALERAIQSASGNLILTTDADCTMGPHWINSFAQYHQLTNAGMITGFVCLTSGRRWFDRLQALEFLSLSGTGATSVIFEKPLMCNGANLAFTKSAFLEAGGYYYGGDLASGDDTFLMLRIARKEKVVFNKNYNGIVTSKPVATMNNFISQRRRWASKVQFYKEGYIKRTGMLLFVVNMALLIVFAAGILNYVDWIRVALIWIVKVVADFIFLYTVSRFARQQQLLLLFLPAAIIYPFYALAGIVSTPGKVKYSWKGREYTVSPRTNES